MLTPGIKQTAMAIPQWTRWNLALWGFILMALALGGCSQIDRKAGAPIDVGGVGGVAASGCEREGDRLVCSRRTSTLRVGAGGGGSRDIHWQVPEGPRPDDGWPVAISFQHSFISAEHHWNAHRNDPFGRSIAAQTVQTLLESGIAVLMPEALADGSTFWETNVPPHSLNWRTSHDHEMMMALFDAIEDGEFGELNADRMYAVGLSSGAYMTSRMGVAYPDRFDALAIHSGSYATCSTPLEELDSSRRKVRTRRGRPGAAGEDPGCRSVRPTGVHVGGAR